MLTDESELLKEIGLKLRQMRIEAGYSSYEQFAFEHEIDRRYYWSIENGTNLSLKYLIRILKIHDMSLATFFKTFE